MTTPFERTIAAQRLAADPAISAFVSANAGSGKTRVLTDRVARLLLAGATPDRILCITYTKAAAAEMSERLFQLLGEWAMMDNTALAAKLEALQPGIAAQFGDEAFARARRLFAQALETPGGLKIQTIHSFCQAVLARFPLEAGVAPGFNVLEDADASGLLQNAIDMAAIAGADEPSIRTAIDRLGRKGDGARSKVRAAMAARAVRAAMLDQKYESALCAHLGEAARLSPAKIMADALADVSAEDLIRLAKVFGGGGGAAKKAPGIARAAKAKMPEDAYLHIRDALLTGDGTPHSRLFNKAMRAADPGAEELVARISEALVAADERLRNADAFADAMALATLLRAVARAYDAAKTARAALDFDDLIDATARLLGDGERSSWVMYKLDQGVEHILLDEAQDTSPEAWKVIEGPLAEFLAGAGRPQGGALARSFFAVGDKKQSIYGFQGADSQLFQQKMIELGKAIAAAEMRFSNVELSLSFRSTPPILAFVDAVFADRATREGLTDELELRHDARRTDEPGLVELWPLTPPETEPEVERWDAPLDAMTASSRERRLALAVADEVLRLIGSPSLMKKGPARPSDVMILVQSRGSIFRETIRALTARGIPTAGADRLDLLDDQGALDLLSFARAAVSDADDLSLAETLKSPLFGADEETLFAIAYGRKGSLRRALWEACETGRAPADWSERFERARAIGRSEGPVAFLMHVLDAGAPGGAPTGRARLLCRLGAPSREPIEALVGQAMMFERSEPRSLRRFIDWIVSRGAEVKREGDQTDDLVRVTTAHKSKGLEAPIVFLVDAHRPPNLGSAFLPLGAADPSGPFAPALFCAKEAQSEALSAAKQTADDLGYDEYRRLLYVAATRARDRLYICGIEQRRDAGGKGDPARRIWYAHAALAFERLKASPGGEAVVEESGELWGRPIQRYGSPELISLAARPIGAAPLVADASGLSPASAPAPALSPPPAHLFVAPGPERPPLRLSPTRLADLAEAADGQERPGPSEPGYRPGADAAALVRGRMIHRLLETLGGVAPANREAAARRLAGRFAPDIAPQSRDAWAREALDVLDAPGLGAAFGPSARAEAAIAGEIAGPRGRVRIAGRVDRLLIEDRRVLVVDFKTNRPPPREAQDAPPAYLAQMGAYAALLARAFPGREVEAALVWTYEARVMILPPDLMARALAAALARAT